MADGVALAPVVPIAAARRRAVARTRTPSGLGPGVEVLSDAELDDELTAARCDADSDLVAILAGPIPRDAEERYLLLGRIAGRLAMEAIAAYEVDASQVDARDDHEANVDALIARLGAVRGGR